MRITVSQEVLCDVVARRQRSPGFSYTMGATARYTSGREVRGAVRSFNGGCMRLSKVALLLLLAVAGLMPKQVSAQAIISNGVVRLGVNPEGHLNTCAT